MDQDRKILVDSSQEELLPEHVGSENYTPDLSEYPMHELKTLLAWSAP